jgi:uncharacterized protein YlzI (FlbEa/FlbD family)
MIEKAIDRVTEYKKQIRMFTPEEVVIQTSLLGVQA